MKYVLYSCSGIVLVVLVLVLIKIVRPILQYSVETAILDIIRNKMKKCGHTYLSYHNHYMCRVHCATVRVHLVLNLYYMFIC